MFELGQLTYSAGYEFPPTYGDAAYLGLDHRALFLLTMVISLFSCMKTYTVDR